jgi:hypothetical protein
MSKLRDKTRQVPNGLKFVQPETGFSPQPWSSFDSIVQQVLQHRQNNKWLAEKYNWAMTREGVATDVEQYNVRLCEINGWTDFIFVGGPPVSFHPARSSKLPDGAGVAEGGLKRRISNAAGGLGLFTTWLGSGLKPVDQALAEKRAKICEHCPKNQLGDFWQKLAGVAAAELRTLIAIKADLELKLPNEDKLHSCSCCQCWLPLKCFSHLDHIISNTSALTMSEFPSHCWIKRLDQ